MKSKIVRATLLVLLMLAGIGLVTVGHGKIVREETWPNARPNPPGPRT